MQKVTDSILTLPDRSDTTLTQISENVTFKWLHDGQAYETATTGAKREDIDAYINANLAAIQEWDVAQPFYSVQNISHKDVSITPYFKARLADVAKTMEERGVKGYSMIVLNNGFSGNLLKLLSRFFVSRVNSSVTQIWFTDYEKAHTELQERMASGE